MARLPQPGGDQGNWGNVLNDYLSQSHASDGTLKPNTVTSSVIADGAIGEAKLDAAAQTKLNTAGVTNGSITTAKLADGAVTKPKLASTVQASLDKADVSISQSQADARYQLKGAASSVGQTQFLPATSFTATSDSFGAEGWPISIFPNSESSRVSGFSIPADAAAIAIDVIWTTETVGSGMVRFVGGMYWIDGVPIDSNDAGSAWQLVVDPVPAQAKLPVISRVGEFEIVPGAPALSLFLTRQGNDATDDTYDGDVIFFGVRVTVTATVPLP